MRIDKIIMLLFAGGIVFLFVMNIWGNWAEKTYERHKNSTYAWLGMDFLGISKTQKNSIRFVKTISWIGMILVVTSAIAIVVLV